ncbi:MAG: DUF4442 domain-containing protein [Bacteroidia bacterium]|nr:DUF4442 domain-containing protein [Bacteroidia bacterium]MCF8427998.1 DUF4442 domain-containing protein [Bacteroidia bacterium]MCF8445722.1 DUF4442 domain-containing protein [Bacteroidia bacterium]
MNLLELPFNQHLGILPSDKEGYILMLPNELRFQNHLQKVHAAALFALAEGTAAQFLLDAFPNVQGIVPVVRKAQVKFSKLAEGKIYGKAQLHLVQTETIEKDLLEKGRVLFSVLATLYNELDQAVLSCEFEWFVSKA